MKVYEKIEGYLPAGIFLSICVAMLLQIFSRTLFGVSFSWNIEFCRYAEVWLAFIGIGYVRRINSHIKISALSDRVSARMNRRGRIAFYLLRLSISLFFVIMLIVLGIQLAMKSWNFRSSALQIRQFWLYICVPIGALGFLWREILHLINYFKAEYGSIK